MLQVPRIKEQTEVVDGFDGSGKGRDTTLSLSLGALDFVVCLLVDQCAILDLTCDQCFKISW